MRAAPNFHPTAIFSIWFLSVAFALSQLSAVYGARIVQDPSEWSYAEVLPPEELAALNDIKAQNPDWEWDSSMPLSSYSSGVVVAEYNPGTLAEPIYDNFGNTLGYDLKKQGHVTSLSAGGNQLTGQIPSSIGNLTELISIFFYGNLLTGEIPSSIGNLTKLTHLTLYGNRLTGNIPASIGNLTQLDRLDLGNNRLAGNIPDSIGNLTQLTLLWLSSNQLNGAIPSSIGNLTKLTQLDLYNNRLTGNIPDSIGNLTKLTLLYLGSNQLTGEIPSSIGNLIRLSSLSLSRNQLSGNIPNSIGNLIGITGLNLNDNQLIGSIPNSILNLPKLVTLNIQKNNLTLDSASKSILDTWNGYVSYLPQYAPDRLKPVVLVAQPAAGAKIVLPAVTANFSGTIKEAGGLPILEYQIINGGPWIPVGNVSAVTPKTGTPVAYIWSVSLPLVLGPNTVAFRATDRAGNVSAIVKRQVNSLTSLSVIVDGSVGSVTKGFAGSSARNDGQTYTVKATPKSGQIFKEWKINGVLTGNTNPTLTFVNEEGLTLEPVFIPNPFIALAGTFPGIFGDGSFADESPAALSEFNRKNGAATFTLAKTGAFTGSLLLAGKRLSLKGRFDGFQNASFSVNYATSQPVSFSLHLDETGANPLITGTATFEGRSLAIQSHRAAYTGLKGSIAPHNGQRFSILLERAPSGNLGYGYTSALIGKNGTAKLAGRLPDGTVVTGSVRVVKKSDGSLAFPLSLPLAPRLTSGLLHGELLPAPDGTPDTEPDLAGTLGWLKAPNANSSFQPAGLLGHLEATGVRWFALSTKATAANLLTGVPGTEAGFTLNLDLQSAVLPSALALPGIWPTTNKPKLTPPVPTGTTFTFNPKTGAFSGTVRKLTTDPKSKVAYSGLLLAAPLDNGEESPALRGAGYLLQGNASGGVEFTQTEE